LKVFEELFFSYLPGPYDLELYKPYIPLYFEI